MSISSPYHDQLCHYMFFRHISIPSVDFTPCPVLPTRKSLISFPLSGGAKNNRGQTEINGDY